MFCYVMVMVMFWAANKVKVFYGLLKEPDINMPLEEEDEAPEGDDKPKVSTQGHPQVLQLKHVNTRHIVL